MFLFFALALLSKTITATLPAAILLLIWWKRGRISANELLAVLPLFALGAAAGLGTAWLEKHHVGASGNPWSFTLAERFLIAGSAVWFYAAKLVWPAHLTFIYPRWTFPAGAWAPYLFPVDAVLVVAVLWFFRAQFGRGPLVAVLYFAGTLFPALGFLNVFPMLYSFVADHFAYLASIGLIALAAACAAAALRRGGARAWVLGVSLACVVLPALGALTWTQCRIYRNQETLWRDTIAKNPSCWMAHVNLGRLLSLRGDSAEAVLHYQFALELNPDDAGARNNLAIELGNMGRTDDAIRQFRESIRRWPSYTDAKVNLAVFLAQKGRWAEAVTEYDALLQVHPDDALAHNNVAWLLATHGPADGASAAEAIRHAERAVALTARGNAGALDTLGAAYAAAGRFEEAIRTAREAGALAARCGDTNVLATVEDHLVLYRAGRTCR